MATRYAFRFDQSACSGCKTCQAACKDRHGLPVGVLWRRVYEVAGGGWLREGEAWRTDAFAYSLSLACKHCAEPVCAEVCPTKAISRRADGIVLIDAGTSEDAGKIAGDADPKCAEAASIFTPVPGGIGPIAVAMIFKNMFTLARLQNN